jgi:D-sedoheptulose 7-phosphate isomerase
VSPETTDFLYPFLEADERDAASLLGDLARSAEAKAAESRRLAAETRERYAGEVEEIAALLAERLTHGGTLFSFGNGGSATDASGFVALLVRPPAGRPLPARSLVADEATLTALGNDVGYDLVFSRQLIAHARPGDVAVGWSTSGNSENLVRAFAEARRLGLVTIGFAGYDGGRMAACGDVDHCFVVRSDSVHRIQEAESALGLALWEAVQRSLGGRAVT